MKHTPGPWKWGEYNEELVSPTGPVIEAIPYEGMMLADENEDANAKLIAAAPDLLRELDSFVCMYVAMVNSGDCGRWDPETEQCVIDAREAIAKATT